MAGNRPADPEHLERLRKASPEEKPDIVLRLIEEHPEGKLDLPGANLWWLDLSQETIRKKRRKWQGVGEPPWWDARRQCAYLGEANLQDAELWYADLRGATLEDANLQGAQLHHAILKGAYIGDARLQGAQLVDASLQDAYLTRAKLQGANLSFADLERAQLWEADLQGADLTNANLQGANLRDSKLQSAYLWHANLQGADLTDADLEEATLRGAKLQGVDLSDTTITHVYISGAWLDRTRLWYGQLGGKIGEERTGNYEEARQGYLALKQNFETLGDYDAASRAYVKERRMEKEASAPWRARRFYGQSELEDKYETAWIETPNGLRLDRVRKAGPPSWHPRVLWFYVRHSWKWLKDWFVELLCGYGENIWLVLIWMAVALFGFSAYYWSIDGVWLMDPGSGFQTVATSFWHYLIYSAGAFTTTEFARFQAAYDLVRLVTAFQAIVGIVLAGLLGFVVGNRIRGS